MSKVIIVGKALHSARVRGVLDRFDCEIFQAESNDEAYKIHSDEKVQLILSVLDLPGMDSDEFCRRIRWNPELRSVSILLACENVPSEIERCKDTKANGFLTLPVYADEFEKKIINIIHVPKRISYNVVTRVKPANSPGPASLHCRMVNVSATGMLLEADMEFQHGESLDLSFFLPGSEHISAIGEVVRVISKSSDQFLYGIRFEDVDARLKHDLEAFLDSHA